MRIIPVTMILLCIPAVGFSWCVTFPVKEKAASGYQLYTPFDSASLQKRAEAEFLKKGGGHEYLSVQGPATVCERDNETWFCGTSEQENQECLRQASVQPLVTEHNEASAIVATTAESDQSKNETQEPKQEGRQETPSSIGIAAELLYREYQENEVAADEKYKDNLMCNS